MAHAQPVSQLPNALARFVVLNLGRGRGFGYPVEIGLDRSNLCFNALEGTYVLRQLGSADRAALDDGVDARFEGSDRGTTRGLAPLCAYEYLRRGRLDTSDIR
jgi:hypothetical protein